MAIVLLPWRTLDKAILKVGWPTAKLANGAALASLILGDIDIPFAVAMLPCKLTVTRK